MCFATYFFETEDGRGLVQGWAEAGGKSQEYKGRQMCWRKTLTTAHGRKTGVKSVPRWKKKTRQEQGIKRLGPCHDLCYTPPGSISTENDASVECLFL